MSNDAHKTQRDIEEYNARNLILQTLKRLKNIPSLRNDTVYRNEIIKGTIINTAIDRLVKQRTDNDT